MTPTHIAEPTRSLKCLGVGEGKPCGRRHSSAFLYRFGSTRLLVDCGDGTSHGLIQAGVGPDDIDALLLSADSRSMPRHGPSLPSRPGCMPPSFMRT